MERVEHATAKMSESGTACLKGQENFHVPHCCVSTSSSGTFCNLSRKDQTVT